MSKSDSYEQPNLNQGFLDDEERAEIKLNMSPQLKDQLKSLLTGADKLAIKQKLNNESPHVDPSRTIYLGTKSYKFSLNDPIFALSEPNTNIMTSKGICHLCDK